MCLYCKVRVRDSIEAHAPMATTSSEDALSESNQAHHASAPRIHAEAEQDYELNQAENFNRKKGTEESSIIQSQDAIG